MGDEQSIREQAERMGYVLSRVPDGLRSAPIYAAGRGQYGLQTTGGLDVLWAPGGWGYTLEQVDAFLADPSAGQGGVDLDLLWALTQAQEIEGRDTTKATYHYNQARDARELVQEWAVSTAPDADEQQQIHRDRDRIETKRAWRELKQAKG